MRTLEGIMKGGKTNDVIRLIAYLPTMREIDEVDVVAFHLSLQAAIEDAELTDRQLKIIEYIQAGFLQKEIAKEMGITQQAIAGQSKTIAKLVTEKYNG